MGFLAELSNHEIQDILDDMGMIDEKGNCPYTTEEIFRTGLEYGVSISENWLKENMDLEHDYPNSNEELINDFKNSFLYNGK